MIVESKLIFIISLIIVIIIGVLGNLLNLFVFSHKSLKYIATFRFLFYLSMIDLFVLTFCASDTLLTYGYQILIRIHSTMACRIHTFLTYFLTHLSSTILMIVSIERAFVICRSRSILSRTANSGKLKRYYVEIFILAVCVFLILINGHYLFFMDIVESGESFDINIPITLYLNNKTVIDLDQILSKNENQTQNHKIVYSCSPPQNFKNYYQFIFGVWIWIDVSLYSLLPFIIMTICSIIILKEINSKSKGFLRQTSRHNKIVTEKARRRNKKLLLMLVLTNTYFILCSLPLCIDILLSKFNIILISSIHFQVFFQIVAYSNNSVNFIFYFLFSNKYRDVVLGKNV